MIRPDRPYVDVGHTRYADKSMKDRYERHQRQYERAIRQAELAQSLGLLGAGNFGIGLNGAALSGAPLDPASAAGAMFGAMAGDEGRVAPGKTSRVPSSSPDLSEMLHPELKDPTQGMTEKEYAEKRFMERQSQLTGPLETMPNRPLELNRYGEISIPNFNETIADPFHELDVSSRSESKGTRKARSVADVVLGEAGGTTPKERLTEMLGIASVIANRAQALGITPEQVVAQEGQFDAYNKAIPPGAEAYADLANQALGYVAQNGPVTSAHYFSASGTKAPAKGLAVAQQGPATTFYDGEFGNYKPGLPTPSAAPVNMSNPFETQPNAGPAGYAYGDLVKPQQVETTEVGAQPVSTAGSWSTTPGSNFAGVDSRLTDILGTAAERFAMEHPGYSAQGFSGKKGRATHTPNHPKGWAGDVTIYDPSGRALPNVRNGQTFGIYQDYANTAKAVQHSKYPDLDDKFTWGGYFKQGTAFDQMHFDIGGVRGAYGSWEEGLNKAGKTAMAQLGFPEVQNAGWSGSPITVADLPAPTARPTVQMASMPDNVGVSVPDSMRVAASPRIEAPSALASLADAFNPVSAAQAEEAPQTAMYDRPAPVAPGYSPPSVPAGPSVNPLDQGVGIPMGGATPGVLERKPFDPAAFTPPEIAEKARALPKPDVMQVPTTESIVATEVPQSQRYSPNMLAPAATLAEQGTALAAQQPTISPVGAPPAQPNAPVSPVAQRNVPQPPEDVFPAAPAPPSNWQKFKSVASPIVDNAMLGNTIGGLPGMAAGAVFGALPAFGVNMDLGPQFEGVSPKSSRFSTGFGLQGINDALNGPFGATGYSLSNPGMSVTSLGQRVGTGATGLRRSDKYGWVETIGPNGEVRGIHYNDPSKGGLLGSLSRAMSDKFGGGVSDKERAEFSGKAGLW